MNGTCEMKEVSGSKNQLQSRPVINMADLHCRVHIFSETWVFLSGNLHLPPWIVNGSQYEDSYLKKKMLKKILVLFIYVFIDVTFHSIDTWN